MPCIVRKIHELTVLRTKSELDFERQPVHYLVVTAQDRGRQPRLSTATVTVLVQDTADEVPIFNTRTYQGGTD